MGAEKTIGIIGAILGGYSSGVIQAELERQKREEELQLQAMRLATTRSGLQTDALQRQMMGKQIAGYESPGEGRRLDTADWEGRQRFGWAREEEVAAAAQAAAQGREQTWMETLPSALPSQHQVRRTLAVSQPQQAPGQGPLGSGQFGLNRMLQQTLAPGAVEPLSVSREATIAPTGPLFRQLHQAGVEYKPVPSPVTGRATPEITQVLTPAQREEQRLGLAEQRTGVAQAGLDLERSEATFEPDVRSAWAGAEREQTEAFVASATAPSDIETARSTALLKAVEADLAIERFPYDREKLPIDLAQAIADLERTGQQVTQEAIVTEYMRTHGGERPPSVSEHTSYTVADPESLRLGWANAQTARYSADIRMGELQLKWDQLSGTAQAPGTEAQRAAVDTGFKAIQDFVDRATDTRPTAPGVAAGSAKLLVTQILTYMDRAGPLAEDLAWALRAAHQLMWQHAGSPSGEDAPEWEGVDWDEVNRRLGWDRPTGPTGRAQQPSARTGADAVPFATAPARSPRRGAPPGLR